LHELFILFSFQQVTELDLAVAERLEVSTEKVQKVQETVVLTNILCVKAFKCYLEVFCKKQEHTFCEISAVLELEKSQDVFKA
jgi:hypothetical protein